MKSDIIVEKQQNGEFLSHEETSLSAPFPCEAIQTLSIPAIAPDSSEQVSISFEIGNTPGALFTVWSRSSFFANPTWLEQVQQQRVNPDRILSGVIRRRCSCAYLNNAFLTSEVLSQSFYARTHFKHAKRFTLAQQSSSVFRENYGIERSQFPENVNGTYEGMGIGLLFGYYGDGTATSNGIFGVTGRVVLRTAWIQNFTNSFHLHLIFENHHLTETSNAQQSIKIGVITDR